jgi:hypothetical protein
MRRIIQRICRTWIKWKDFCQGQKFVATGNFLCIIIAEAHTCDPTIKHSGMATVKAAIVSASEFA